MPLICAGTPLLRKCSAKSDRDVCDDFVKAADAAFNAQVEVSDNKLQRYREKESRVIRGEDVSTLIVLQREMGCVAPSEYNPISRSCIQSRVCSIDATTCLVVALRDPYSGTTVCAHFDHAGKQVEDGIPAMINFLPAKPITTHGLLTNEQRTSIEELQDKHKAKRVVQVYAVGAVKFPKFSAETCAAVLRAMADETDVVFDVVLDGVCVWSQNLRADGRNLTHRGLLVDSKTGASWPVECDKKRAYPAGRLRNLRSLNADDPNLSAITLLPGESVTTAMPVDQQGERKALQHVLIVRPFKFPTITLGIARRPLDFFMSLSTTPEMEPADFAETLKSALVYGSLTNPTRVFPPMPKRATVQSPVAFQLAIGTAASQPAEADAAAAASSEAPVAAVEEANNKSDDTNHNNTAAPAVVAPREIAFEWVQISPLTEENKPLPPL